MNHLKAFSIAVFLIELTFPQPIRAASTLSPTQQVDELVEWFTGNFNNAQQVNRDPSVPSITLSTCQVQLADATEPSGTRALYLEQPEISRFRFYSFSPGEDAVDLNIRSFVNPTSVRGICSETAPRRLISPTNLATAVCSLELFREVDSYVGSNAPGGCPTSTGGKVVSSITLQEDSIFSLDQIFTRSGQLIAGTPIEFRRPKAVPEPVTVPGLMLAGSGLVWLGRRRRSRAA